jgi:predicted methyltransferase
MLKLEKLDENLITMIDKVLENQSLCKYIFHDVDDPLAEADIPDTNVILFNRIFPYPFDPGIASDDQTQLRIYYPEGQFNETAVEEIEVYFDIVVAKESLWLINRAGKKQIRPVRIMAEIVNMFNKKSIETIGQLEFSGFSHRYVNEKFDAYQVVARMTNFTNG